MNGISPTLSTPALDRADRANRSDPGVARPALPVDDESDESSQAAKAAHDLEAFFLRQMLAEVRPEGGMLDGGFAGATFREMLDGALSEKIADCGGLGLADVLRPELERAANLPHAGARGESSTPPARAAAAYRAATNWLPADDPGMPQPTLRALPVDGEVASPFGRRTDPIEGDVRTHAGVDIAAPEGTSVRAAGDGVVVRSGRAGGYGNLVVVDHGGGLQTRYGHLSRIDVASGERVSAGATVGAVGQTGRATGPHLHFEVRRDGRAVDPGVSARSGPTTPGGSADALDEKKRALPLNPGEARPNRQRGGQ